ncbi:MAG: ATP-dependent DNA helicase RecG [Planctomycetota bacterium]|nr:ATP-dependent DNA helicase RecG [Planctomycetota bacterium]
MSGPRHAPDAPVGVLPGVTAKREEAFGRLGVETLEDLLRLAPRRLEDRRHPTPIEALEAGVTALVIGRVVRSKAFRVRGGMSILEAEVEDATGALGVRWFQRGYVPKPLPQGRRVALYGPVKARAKVLELASPQMERLPDDPADDAESPGAGRLVPVHPSTSGLSPVFIRRAVWEALRRTEPPVDPVPEAMWSALELPALADALRALHFPDTEADAEAARRRMAFDELLVHELLVARKRRAYARHAAPACRFTDAVDERIRARLPFTLTDGQDHAVGEIVRDLEQPHPMNRLLQGDVGSGKTAVAVYAALGAIASGLQVAFMAPTEVLARQHARTLGTLLEGSRVRTRLLLGGQKAAERREAEAAIAAHEVDLVLGTHAVLGEGIAFAHLGLVVVDEQHKFGVRQRRTLVQKGKDTERPHCLVMTATPIPRTLALTVYGDLDTSIIQGRPPGREPVETWVAKPRQGRTVFKRVREALDAGNQAYVVYPLVEESENLALRDAVDGAERWRRALPGREVGLLHGRLKREEKDEVMRAFSAGTLDVLVSTLVIEVGVDVPNATVLVIEHAERFGLSQLHQLRGRIGRGKDAGLCVLIDRSTKTAPARLEVLARTDDGFEIAEEDLRLRGVGDLFGTRQSGRPDFRAARLPRDLPLLLHAREAAATLTRSDAAPELDAHPLLRERLARKAAWMESPALGG